MAEGGANNDEDGWSFAYGQNKAFDIIGFTFYDNQRIFGENDLFLSEEEKALIPFDGYYMYIDFWNDEYAKRLVECLLPIYPKCWLTMMTEE